MTGITFVPIGIAGGNAGLWAMGLVLLMAGLANKNKWGQHTRWADYAPRLRKIKIIVVSGLAVLMLTAVAYVGFDEDALGA